MTTTHTPTSEARFRALFEQAPVSIQLLSPTGQTLQVNQAWEALWDPAAKGLLKQYVLNGGYNILTDPQLVAKGIAPLLRRSAAGERVALPVICYDPAELGLPGAPRWVKATAHPITGNAGEVLEIMLIHEDVTEAHYAQEAERASEQKLQHGLAAARMVVWEWTVATRALGFTDNVTNLLGAHPSSIDAFDSNVHPEDRERLDVARRVAFATGSTYQEVVRYRRADDGREIWLDIRGEVQFNPAGVPEFVRGVTLDITERMTAEAELRDADRRKDQFLAMLAHELRNPLAPVSTAAQLLKLNGMDAQRLHACDVIIRQVAHMTDLIEDLLDVSRVKRGLVELQLEPLDLRTVVRDAVEQASPLIEARQHMLLLDMPPQPAVVNGDRLRLIQVISNLLTNAAKYTAQEGRIGIQITIGNQVELSVADNGVGIEPVELTRMFELFTQAERTPDRSQGGLGLGLPLVKSIVELHGGRVSAQSEGAGTGSTFILHLPRADGAIVPEASPAAPASINRQAKVVMIVDDNIDAGTSLAALLTARGHTVSVAMDGKSALQMARTRAIDVFILDIGLPDMDGLTLARRLRGSDHTSGSVLIALTGYGQAHDRILSKSAGFDMHLVKPASIERLEAAFYREGFSGQDHNHFTKSDEGLR